MSFENWNRFVKDTLADMQNRKKKEALAASEKDEAEKPKKSDTFSE